MDKWNGTAAANGWTLEEEQIMLLIYLPIHATIVAKLLGTPHISEI